MSEGVRKMYLNSWRLPLTHGIELILQTYLACEDCLPGDFMETACCLRCTPRMCTGQRPPLLYFLLTVTLTKSRAICFKETIASIWKFTSSLTIVLLRVLWLTVKSYPASFFCYSQGAFLPVTLATEQLTEQANHRSKVRATSLSHPQPGSCTKLKSAFSR